jgi:hypothetical protein
MKAETAGDQEPVAEMKLGKAVAIREARLQQTQAI